MAANRFSCTTASGGISIAADSNPHTALAVLAPASFNVKVMKFVIGFTGVVVTDKPIQWQLVVQTQSGTSAVSVTPQHVDAVTTTIQSTSKSTYTAEPTTTRVVDGGTIQPQLNGGEIFPLSREYVIPAGAQIGIVLTNSGTNANTAMCSIECEE